MSWFSRKKIPKVPFPPGHPAGEGALRFPSLKPEERVIEPTKVKEAVGLEPPSITEEAPSRGLPPLPSFEKAPVTERMPSKPAQTTEEMPPRPVFRTSMVSTLTEESEPLYVKVDVYQRLLGEIDSIKKEVTDAFEISKDLETSEYNEEENFAKLKRSVRIIHDRLLQVDKTLFKSQGD
ncbi:hypothetical protein HY496_01090 [Candidatus Woesearchaeota archaeon]|nr:hypothetical protein [Candidatus Woesearchaeota archaeon]